MGLEVMGEGPAAGPAVARGAGRVDFGAGSTTTGDGAGGECRRRSGRAGARDRRSQQKGEKENKPTRTIPGNARVTTNNAQGARRVRGIRLLAWRAPLLVFSAPNAAPPLHRRDRRRGFDRSPFRRRTHRSRRASRNDSDNRGRSRRLDCSSARSNARYDDLRNRRRRRGSVLERRSAHDLAIGRPRKRAGRTSGGPIVGDHTGGTSTRRASGRLAGHRRGLNRRKGRRRQRRRRRLRGGRRRPSNTPGSQYARVLIAKRHPRGKPTHDSVHAL